MNIIKNVLCLNTSISEEVIFTIYSTFIVCVGNRSSDYRKANHIVFFLNNAKHPWDDFIITLIITHLKWPLKHYWWAIIQQWPILWGWQEYSWLIWILCQVTIALGSDYISPTHAASLYSICDQTHMESRAFIIAGLAKMWKSETNMCAHQTNC